MISIKFLKQLTLVMFTIVAANCFAQDVLKTNNTESVLYLGEGKKQPLIVGLGGAEGGNAWTSDYWKATRDQFIEKGYAFLAIGYFGANGTPKLLEKIEIEDIHNAILLATNNKQICKNKIAILGGSRGADLALIVSSYYKNIDCVVGLVASDATFPGHTTHFSTSSWSFKGKELPFVPVSEEAVPFMIKRDLRGAFQAMMKDTVAYEKAKIKVENITGPILLISADKDEIAPTTSMSNRIMDRLEKHNFKYPKEHIVIEGGHAEPLKHFDLIFRFLEKHFPVK